MNKLLLGVSALILGLGITTDTRADCNGIYLAGRGGIAWHDYSSDKGSQFETENLDKKRLMLSGALGYRHDYYRLEMEYIWRDKSKNSYDDGIGGASYNFKSYSVMLNGYIDFAPFRWISPFVNAGIGYSQLKYSDRYGDGSSSTKNGNYKPAHFTWSLGGGLTVKVTNRFNVDVGYRYFDMGSIKHADVTDQEIYGGIRYVF